jgi:hypothetical protein
MNALKNWTFHGFWHIMISKNVIFTRGANLFLSAEFFCRSDRTILRILGNTTAVRMSKTEISFDKVLFIVDICLASNFSQIELLWKTWTHWLELMYSWSGVRRSTKELVSLLRPSGSRQASLHTIIFYSTAIEVTVVYFHLLGLLLRQFC